MFPSRSAAEKEIDRERRDEEREREGERERGRERKGDRGREREEYRDRERDDEREKKKNLSGDVRDPPGSGLRLRARTGLGEPRPLEPLFARWTFEPFDWTWEPLPFDWKMDSLDAVRSRKRRFGRSGLGVRPASLLLAWFRVLG